MAYSSDMLFFDVIMSHGLTRFLSLQLKSSEVDHSIDLTLGNFNDAAPLFSASDTKQTLQFIGITNYPTTPVAPRQMPPLAYPQPKQSATFVNGVTSASGAGSNNATSRPYNNNNAININGNQTANSGANNYQQKALTLAPPPQSRASVTASFNNTFARPPDAKPLNGRSSYPTNNTQSSKHEVSIRSFFSLPNSSLIDCSGRLLCDEAIRRPKNARLTAECLFISSLPVLCVTQLVSVYLRLRI